MPTDLGAIAEQRGIKYFLISFTDLLGVQRAKLVPSAAIDGMAKAGAAFAGFETWLDMTPADPDLFAVPDPDSLIQLPWKPEVAWVASDLVMNRVDVAQNPRQVLKRAVDSEKEAFQQKISTALTPANYRFRLLGSDMVAGRPVYVLAVEPLVPSKFLYRGKIWLDAAEFAAVKMETEPSKSPSFWITRTQIHYTGSKTDGFWMPERVRTETSVRIGGNAVFTIEYGKYQIERNPPQPAGGGS